MSAAYTPHRSITPMPAKKSAGTEFKENMFYFVIIIGVYYIIVGIFKVLTAPFRAMFATDKERLGNTLEGAKAKVAAREQARRAYEISPWNMLTQYTERFKIRPESYPFELDNRIYKEWFEAWQNGTILDSELTWAPEVYLRDYEDQKYWNVLFLDYLQNQVNLHMQDTYLARHTLLKTIRNFYPEFTPKLSLIPAEIVELRERAKAKTLKIELIDAIEKKGIPQSVAIEIVNSNVVSPERLKASIVTVKKCIEHNFSRPMMDYCVKNDYDPTDYLAPTIDNLLNRVGNEDICTALIHGRITPEELVDITNKANSVYSDLTTRDNREKWRKSIGFGFERLMKDKVLKGC